MDWIKSVIQQLIRHRFYGKLTIHFESGKIVRAVKEESLKPE
jgi:hypothetical protein